jgi:hypothetical protein
MGERISLGSDEDVAEGMEWALQISDKCARKWPTVSRLKVTGTLFHLFNWHHHSPVLIVVKQIARLDGALPACAKESDATPRPGTTSADRIP